MRSVVDVWCELFVGGWGKVQVVQVCKCASARLKANRRLEAVILCVD